MQGANCYITVLIFLFRNYPSVGVQLRGGPVVVDQNRFYGYTSTGGREAYAVGFYPQNQGQFGTSTYVGSNTLAQTVSEANRLLKPFSWL